MRSFASMLNGLLIDVFHNIMRAEEEFLQKGGRISLSIREMHLIEFVGEDRITGRTISEIARYLNVARPSVTVAVRKLEGKGYLERGGCESDGRVVRVTLTREGRRMFLFHKRYHAEMVSEIEKDLTGDERELLIRVIGKLSAFFAKSVEATV